MKKGLMWGGYIFFLFELVACNDGSRASRSPADNANVMMSDYEILAAVKSTNVDFQRGTNDRPAGTWRWPDTPERHVLVYIPVAANSTEQEYATKVTASIALINSKLVGLLVLKSTTRIPINSNYIEVSYGTSYVERGSTDYQNYCANVSMARGRGDVIVPDSQNGIYSNPVYLNLGNGRCNLTQDIVTHEFGHALGLAIHFNGFGNGPAISDAFWDALATLYGNPQSTTDSNLVVKRAAK